MLWGALLAQPEEAEAALASHSLPEDSCKAQLPVRYPACLPITKDIFQGHGQPNHVSFILPSSSLRCPPPQDLPPSGTQALLYSSPSLAHEQGLGTPMEHSPR